MIPCDPDVYRALPPDLRQALESVDQKQVERFQRERRPFTWDNARDVAIIVRDGLLMIVKGLERVFDLGKK